MALWCGGCSAAIRPAPFPGARDHVADVSLKGPFNGQVVDVGTSEPIVDALVVGVWSYERGDGIVVPWGSEVLRTTTDRAGRYQLPSAPQEIRGPTTKMVSFTLWVYRQGYLGYRSDLPYDDAAGVQFVARHHRIALRKWQPTDSHAAHLLALVGPPEISLAQRWERTRANGALLGAEGPGEAGVVQPTLDLLDASALLPVEDVRRRTGFTGPFEVKELADLARTHFYHSVHLQAVDRDETWDLAYRVWRDPPGGLDSVIATFEATLPEVEPSGEITEETWVADTDRIRAVAFVDRDKNIGVLLTCGVMQCVDVETTILLARLVHERLDELGTVSTAEVPARSEATGSEATPTEAAPSEATPSEAAPTEAAPSEVTPSEAAPTEAAPTEAAPTEAAPREVTPSEAAPSEAAPTEPTSTPPARGSSTSSAQVPP